MRLCKVVSLDAFNTLVVPKRPVLLQYKEISSKYGINTTEKELGLKFPSVFKKMKKEYPNYGKYKISNVNWWEMLIEELYSHDIPQECVDEIISTFESNKGYGTFDDTEIFLKTLNLRKDVIVILSSDGEPRILKVLESLNLLKYINNAYLSYNMEILKSDYKFYEYIYNDLQIRYPEYDFLKSNFYHIGDELEKDLNNSFNAGWTGILLNKFENKNNLNEINKKIVMNYENTQIDNVFFNKIQDRKYSTNSFNEILKLINVSN